METVWQIVKRATREYFEPFFNTFKASDAPGVRRVRRKMVTVGFYVRGDMLINGERRIINITPSSAPFTARSAAEHAVELAEKSGMYGNVWIAEKRGREEETRSADIAERA